MNNQLIMHVNYAEEGYLQYNNKSIDDICRMAAECGYDGIEFRGEPPRELTGDSVEEYMTAIGKCKKKYGLTDIIFGIDLFNSASTDKEKREKEIEESIKALKLANDLCGSTVINSCGTILRCPVETVPMSQVELCGSAAATEEQWNLTVDAFQRFGEAAETLGIKVGLETHFWYIHDLPEPTRKLIDLIDSPAIGVNMDFGNTVKFPKHPTVPEAIDIYGEKLYYVHLKNSVAVAGDRIATAMSEGEINHREYLAKLKSIGFEGPIGLEAVRSGDKRWFAQKDAEYIKAVMNAV